MATSHHPSPSELLRAAIKAEIAELEQRIKKLNYLLQEVPVEQTEDFGKGVLDVAKLTTREREVLSCIVAGMTNKEAGNTLGISHRTVELHRSRIFTKTRTKNAVDLINALRIEA